MEHAMLNRCPVHANIALLEHLTWRYLSIPELQQVL
jgi:hypothetical protein